MGCFVHGSLVRGFRPGVGRDGRLLFLLQTRPRPEPTAYHQVINCALPTDTDTDTDWRPTKAPAPFCRGADVGIELVTVQSDPTGPNLCPPNRACGRRFRPNMM